MKCRSHRSGVAPSTFCFVLFFYPETVHGCKIGRGTSPHTCVFTQINLASKHPCVVWTPVLGRRQRSQVPSIEKEDATGDGFDEEILQRFQLQIELFTVRRTCISNLFPLSLGASS